jgi:GNAT superfamily N-acetyltransferase
MPVGAPGQVGRYVIVDYSPERYRAVAAIAGPDVFIEVCARREAVTPWLPEGWTVRDRGYLMSRSLGSEASNPPEGFDLIVGGDGERIEATVRSTCGDLAARGVCGLVGQAAVFDQIVTEEAFRRRGLGRAVMATLSNAASARRATSGVLIATAPGRALYVTLGWTEVSEVTSVISA